MSNFPDAQPEEPEHAVTRRVDSSSKRPTSARSRTFPSTTRVLHGVSLTSGYDCARSLNALGSIRPRAGATPNQSPKFPIGAPLDSNLGSSTGLGDFYYYPSWVSNDPPWAANVSTLFSGTDLTPYIAAPGRFTVDLTTLRSADGEGWQDYGANMMEYLETYSQTTNAGEYCDTTDPVTLTAAQVKAGATCPAGTCGRINLATGDTDCGTVRATQMPPIPWEGGSWEGHGIQLYGYNEPAHTQYGKAGFRCVRPAEP